MKKSVCEFCGKKFRSRLKCYNHTRKCKIRLSSIELDSLGRKRLTDEQYAKSVSQRKTVVDYIKEKYNSDYIDYNKRFKVPRKALFPYNNYFIEGLYTNNEHRLIIFLIKYPNIRLIISYAKYLYEVSHKTLVKDGYEVDHIDGDKTNNIVSNLQILTKKENLRKSFSEGTYKLLHKYTRVLLWCPVCNKKFTRMKSKIDTSLVKKGKKFYFCSRGCQHQSLFDTFVFPKSQKVKNIKIDWNKYKHKNCYENPKEYSTKFFTKITLKRIKFLLKKKPLVYICKKLKIPKSTLNKVIKYKL